MTVCNNLPRKKGVGVFSKHYGSYKFISQCMETVFHWRYKEIDIMLKFMVLMHMVLYLLNYLH